MLYIVPTPVGNLDDMTFRAVATLRKVDLILAEDTRTSGILLKHFDIHTPMQSFHQHNEHQATHKIVEKLKEGKDIALISDAGTPGISDPGFLLSRACREKEIEICCLPGATAFVPALIDSGLPADHFIFEGFLPPKKGRATRLAELAMQPRTVIIYESPVRLAKTLRQLSEAFGADRQAAVVREISKVHESIYRDNLHNLTRFFEMNQAKGEIVIVVKGCTDKKINIS